MSCFRDAEDRSRFYLVRYTNAPWLVNAMRQASADHGCSRANDTPASRLSGTRPVGNDREAASRQLRCALRHRAGALVGSFSRLPTAARRGPVLAAAGRALSADPNIRPKRVSKARHRRSRGHHPPHRRRDGAGAAFSRIEIDAADRMDRLGRSQARQITGRPVAIHAMRGISAHTQRLSDLPRLHSRDADPASAPSMCRAASATRRRSRKPAPPAEPACGKPGASAAGQADARPAAGLFPHRARGSAGRADGTPHRASTRPIPGMPHWPPMA